MKPRSTPEEVEEMIQLVKITHESCPGVTWADLFTAIPNRYASAKSMQDSLCAADRRLGIIGAKHVDGRVKAMREHLPPLNEGRAQPSKNDAPRNSAPPNNMVIPVDKTAARRADLRAYGEKLRANDGIPSVTVGVVGIQNSNNSLKDNTRVLPLRPRLLPVPDAMLGMIDAVLSVYGFTQEQVLDWKNRDPAVRACRDELVRVLRDETVVYGEPPAWKQIMGAMRAAEPSCLARAYAAGKAAHKARTTPGQPEEMQA